MFMQVNDAELLIRTPSTICAPDFIVQRTPCVEGMERHRRLNKTLQATAVSALSLIFGPPARSA
jgi:hypothetical protein